MACREKSEIKLLYYYCCEAAKQQFLEVAAALNNSFVYCCLHSTFTQSISFTVITRLGSGGVYNYLLIIRITQLNLSKWWNDVAAATTTTTMTIVGEIVFYI